MQTFQMLILGNSQKRALLNNGCSGFFLFFSLYVTGMSIKAIKPCIHYSTVDLREWHYIRRCHGN